MSELKPCPFCGADAVLVTKHKHLAYFIECSNDACSAHIAEEYEYEVIKAWNNRPIEDALRAELAALREANRWIPVEELLPEHKEKVLAYSLYDNCDMAFYDYETSHWYWDVPYSTEPTIMYWKEIIPPETADE